MWSSNFIYSIVFFAIILLIYLLIVRSKRENEKKLYIKNLKKSPLSHQYYVEGLSGLILDHTYSIETTNEALLFTKNNQTHGQIALRGIVNVEVTDLTTLADNINSSDWFFWDIIIFFLTNDKKDELFRLRINWLDDNKNECHTDFDYVGDYAKEAAYIAQDALREVISRDGNK